MSENKPMIPPKGGFLKDLTFRIKLILRLMGDSRVNPLLKVIPVGAVVYLIFPDLAPGPIDDAAILWLGAYLFVELCPQDVVAEHMAALGHEPKIDWHDVPGGEDENVIDAEYREK